MKNDAILICVLLLFFSLNILGQPKSLSVYGAIGNVKSIEEKTIGYTDDGGKDKKSFESAAFTMYFDKAGRLTSRTIFSTGGSTEEVYYYQADGVRKAVSETRRPFASPNEKSIPSVYGSVFKFDKEKNCLTEDTFSAFRQIGPDYKLNDPGQRYKYCFDDLGRMNKKVVMNEKGSEVMTTEYYFRSDGPPTQEVQTTGGRAFAAFRIAYEFDSNNNWIKRTKIADPPGQRDPVYKSVTTRKIDYYK